MVNGNECKDYKLTTDFAKHLAMESHSAKGKIARKYFIAVENKAVEMANAIKYNIPHTNEEKLFFMMECQAEVFERVKVVEQQQKEASQNIDDIYDKLDTIQNKLPILPIEADKVSNAVKARGCEILGGKNALAYKDKSVSKKVYGDIYSQLYREFGIKSYKALQRDQVEMALKIIGEYKCPIVLRNRIDNTNNQMSFL